MRGGGLLQFGLLGPLEVRDGSQPVIITREKVRALLALLLVHRGQVLSTDRIADELWPGTPPARPSGAVQNYVSILRRLLDPTAIADTVVTRPAGYELRVPGRDVDAVRFCELAETTRVASGDGRLADVVEESERALGLWRGPVLADLRFYDFVGPYAQRLEELLRSVQEQRFQAQLGLGHHAQVVGELESAIAEDPLREPLWGQLMLALYRCGRQAEALAAYQTVRRTLDEELGLQPGTALRDLEARILRQDPSLDPIRTEPPSAGVPSRQEPGVPHNLPRAPTGFVGRTRELGQLGALLERGEVRLLTLTGPGGAGKTRLAVELATMYGRGFEEVCFVPLAAIRQSSMLVPAILQAMDAPLPAHQAPLDALGRLLGSRRILLLLDNLEQIDGAGAVIDQLVASAANVTIVATSRTPLRTASEHEFAVPPMNLPAATAAPSEGVGETEAEAITLFAQRASAVQPGFAVSPENAAAVAEICLRVDGLPLAIELAAARIRALSPRELADRLDPRLDMLTRGAADLPDRQRTLRDTIAWSHDLLDLDEQLLFRQLSVFAGGCSLAAVEVVVDSAGIALLDGITALVESSLLLRDEPVPGTSRFRMLETIREYALELLEASGESSAVHRRHADHHLSLAQRADQSLYVNEEQVGLAEFDREHGNVTAALEWALSDSGPRDGGALALELVAAMGLYWYTRGHIRAGIDWIERALAAGLDAPADLRAAPAFWLGGMLDRSGDHARAREWMERSVELMRESDGGDTYRVAAALNGAATAALHQGDLAGARAAFQAGFEVYQAIDSSYGMGVTLLGLGDCALQEGDIDQAAELFGEAMRWYEQTDHTWDIAIARCHLARVTLEQLDLDRTEILISQAIEVLRERGELAYLAACLEIRAGAAAHREAPALAGRLLGAAEATRESIGARQAPPLQALIARHVELARARDPEGFEAARLEGAAAPLETILDEVSALPPRAAMRSGTPPRSRASGP